MMFWICMFIAAIIGLFDLRDFIRETIREERERASASPPQNKDK